MRRHGFAWVRACLLAAFAMSLVLPTSSGAADSAPHQLIVNFTDAVSPSERVVLRRELGVVHTEALRIDDMVVYETDRTVSVPKALEVARRSGLVEFAEPNYLYRAELTTDDTLFPVQWALHNTGQSGGVAGADIGVTGAWDVTTGGPSTVVAVIDSGINYSHEDLTSRVHLNSGESGAGKEANSLDDDANGFVDDYRGWDFLDADNDATDIGGHGTSMSGIAGAAGNNGLGLAGAAFDARIMPLRVGTVTFPVAAIVSAVYYAGNNGADVVNMSFAGVQSNALHTAIQAYPNLVFVAAAGNDGSSVPEYPCALSAANIVCVAATDRYDGLAGFSNYGTPHVDVGAPGVALDTTAHSSNNGYRLSNGTSPATAITSGAIALIRTAHPTWTASAVKSRLLDTADPIASLAGKVVTGSRIDVGDALDFVVPETTLNAMPPATNDATPTFTFSSSEPSGGFECRLGSGGWYACASPHTTTTLTDGLNTFFVRAVDSANNVDPTAAEAAFVVDTVPADTTIDSGPSGFVSDDSATFAYSASDGGSAFECKLDGSAYTSCPASGKSYPGLSEAPHTFTVRSVDAVGNLDPTPAVRSWMVDALAPVTTIDSQPEPLTDSTTAVFGFTASESSTFECSLDDEGWAPCSSGVSYSGLDDGSHAFSVRATDAAGNPEGSPPVYDWMIDATPPATTIDGGPPSTSQSTIASFTYASEPGASFQCKLDGDAYARCAASGVTYVVGVGNHRFSVRAGDALGNVGSPATYDFAITALGVRPLQRTALPNTTLIKKAPRKSAERRVVFTFAGGDSYRYKIDGKSWGATSKTSQVLRVKSGKHVFRVAAVNGAGRDPTPAKYRFMTLRG